MDELKNMIDTLLCQIEVSNAIIKRLRGSGAEDTGSLRDSLFHVKAMVTAAAIYAQKLADDYDQISARRFL